MASLSPTRTATGFSQCAAPLRRTKMDDGVAHPFNVWRVIQADPSAPQQPPCHAFQGAWLPMPYHARWFLMECPTVRNLPAVASSGLPLRWVTARVPIPSKMVGPARGDANVQCSSYLSLCHRKYTSGGRGGLQSYRGSLRLWHCGLTRPGRIGAGAQGTKRPGPPGQIRAHLQRITGRPGVVVPI